MEPIKSTSEILAFKFLNWSIDKVWVDWAVEMLVAGFDSPNLVMLAGESPPYNQFELRNLTDKVFAELNLDYSDKDRIIKNYACYLIDKNLNGELDSYKVLMTLKNICIELDYEKYLYDFYSLFFAKDDLLHSENQWYWEGANKGNIDQIIHDHFVQWKSNYQTGLN
jgi:hypothetical protein